MVVLDQEEKNIILFFNTLLGSITTKNGCGGNSRHAAGRSIVPKWLFLKAFEKYYVYIILYYIYI